MAKRYRVLWSHALTAHRAAIAAAAGGAWGEAEPFLEEAIKARRRLAALTAPRRIRPLARMDVHTVQRPPRPCTRRRAARIGGAQVPIPRCCRPTRVRGANSRHDVAVAAQRRWPLVGATAVASTRVAAEYAPWRKSPPHARRHRTRRCTETPGRATTVPRRTRRRRMGGRSMPAPHVRRLRGVAHRALPMGLVRRHCVIECVGSGRRQGDVHQPCHWRIRPNTSSAGISRARLARNSLSHRAISASHAASASSSSPSRRVRSSSICW